MWHTLPFHLRAVFAASLLAMATFVLPGDVFIPFGNQQAFADEEPPPPPPLPDEEQAVGPDDAAPEGDRPELVPLQPGEAVVTRFSHTASQPDAEGQAVESIDVNGISASIIDIRRPGEPPSGQHWIDEPQRMFVTAGEVGQVFGVALGKRADGRAPDIFLSATAAFGLHRTGKAPGKTEWMAGMWGPDSGPGSIFRMSDDTGYLAEKFADVMLDGRENTGAALGNIAYDQWHNRLFASDLETGMIHALDVVTGKNMGHFDHGVTGRAGFFDSLAGKPTSLPQVPFDPATSANIEECASDFAATPECWNIADFRRRVWGLNVRKDSAGEVRLFYSVWGSDAFGNPDWPTAGDDRRNAVWSVAITAEGQFDETTVRREFFMPAFWPATPAMGDKAGNSNAVSDIVFPECGLEDVMLVSERGGMRNLGLDQTEAFARPYESRVLRYERGADGIWRLKGRYDVGFHDRSAKDGDPVVFASAAGGADFNYGLTEDGVLDSSKPSQSVWMTGDGLCSPAGPCTGLATGEHDDDSEVHGLQGSPAAAFGAVEPSGKPDTAALDQSYMIDTDINIGNDGAPVPAERMRNDATRIGDVAIYQVCQGTPPLTEIDVPDEVLPPGEPPEDWPVHTLNLSHQKWASSGHRLQRSWHRREGSWHAVDRSWHWRSQSYHGRNQSWHWRGGSWHSKAKSWHRKGQSLHDKRYSWHGRDRSWHLRDRSYHNKVRSWDGNHNKGKSYHVRDRSWSGDHRKGKSYHVRDRSWSGDHQKGKSYHVRDRSWSGDHRRGKSYHVRDRSWGGGHIRNRSYHNKNKSWSDDRPNHVKNRSYHNKNKTWGGGDEQPPHTKKKSDADNRPQHKKVKSDADNRPQHKKVKSDADNRPQHKKVKSEADNRPKHKKVKSEADNRPKHAKDKSKARKKQKHKKKTSEFVDVQ